MQKFISFLKEHRFVHVALFIYFGFMAIPQWFLFFSPQFLVWLFLLPVVLLALIGLGLWGIGILRTKRRKEAPSPKHKSFLKIAGFGFLCLAVFIPLAFGTHHLHNHRKFNSKIWQNQIQ